MPFFLLHHQHSGAECDAAFAAWQGFASPLRGSTAASSCLAGGHAVWWRVEALDSGTRARPAAALRRRPDRGHSGP